MTSHWHSSRTGATLATCVLLALLTTPAVAQVTAFCRTYTLPGPVCSSCLSGYFLSNGSCVAVAGASVIQNCTVYGSASTCVACINGYTPNANQTACVAITPGTAGSNCLSVAATGSCERCAAGYILNSATNTCVSGVTAGLTVDPLCADQRFNNGSFCSLCRQGYTLTTTGQCSLVVGSENCLVYDPDSTNNRCRVCMSGYSMLTASGNCELNVVANTGVVDPLNSGSSARVAVLASLAMLVAFR